jgi:regulatory protein
MSDTPQSIYDLNNDLFEPEEVDRFSSPQEARKKAMDYLARREHGWTELKTKMVKAGFDDDVAAAALERLRDQGLQDDRRFVEAFVQSRVNQGKGPARIRADLGQRGLAAGLVDQVLEDSDADWFAMAQQVRARKFGDDLPADFKEKARQMRFLQYRGFEQAHIQSAVSACNY